MRSRDVEHPWRLKCAIPSAGKELQVVLGSRGIGRKTHDDIELTIAIEVSHRRREYGFPDEGNRYPFSERSVSISEQNQQRLGSGPKPDQVELAVFVEITSIDGADTEGGRHWR